MIRFTDRRIFVKGTCNVLLEDIRTGDIVYQSNKMSVGDITPSATLNEIRAGLGNPIAAMISSDASLTVNFEAADFQLWAKAAQLGTSVTYSAPVPTCKTAKATGQTLVVDVSDGVPVPELGSKTAYAYVQTVGESSHIAEDGTAYPISSTGEITGFSATSDVTYKVWYFIEKVNAKKAVIGSFIDPKTVRFIAQIAVYSNLNNGSTSQGTRIGWLYYTIPYMKMQADASITGDQNNNDVTKISGTALAYEDPDLLADCNSCFTTTLGYMVYAPDESLDTVKGLVVVGGIMTITNGDSARIPIRFVMADGSLVEPTNYSDGFTYTVAAGSESVISVTDDGILTALTFGEGECDVTYTDPNGNVYTCTIIVVAEKSASESWYVGYGTVGYMIIA